MISLLLYVAIQGCASGLIGELPAIKDKESASQIYIFNPSFAVSFAHGNNNFSCNIILDGKPFVALRPYQFTKIYLQSGKHSLGITYPSNDASYYADISFEPIKTYYFKSAWLSDNIKLEQIEEYQVNRYMNMKDVDNNPLFTYVNIYPGS